MVGSKNERVYGANLTNDLSGGSFPEAYGAWSRVRGVPLTDFVPINRAQRQAVYEVSPAARELRESLEDPANVWSQTGCPTVGVCGDFAGGWEVWALRDAAARAGHFATEAEFQAFFARLAGEIEAGCDAGQLQCAPNLPPSLQPVLRARVGDTLQSAFYWLGQLPVNSTYYVLYGRDYMFAVPDADRAILQQGMTGVAATDDLAAAQLADRQSVHWFYASLERFFPVLFLFLLALSVLGLILGAVWRRERPRRLELCVLSAALGVAIATRLVLFAVIDTTQYLVDPRYHYATRTLLLALAAIGAINLVHVVGTHRTLRSSAGLPQK